MQSILTQSLLPKHDHLAQADRASAALPSSQIGQIQSFGRVFKEHPTTEKALLTAHADNKRLATLDGQSSDDVDARDTQYSVSEEVTPDELTSPSSPMVPKTVQKTLQMPETLIPVQPTEELEAARSDDLGTDLQTDSINGMGKPIQSTFEMRGTHSDQAIPTKLRPAGEENPQLNIPSLDMPGNRSSQTQSVSPIDQRQAPKSVGPSSIAWATIPLPQRSAGQQPVDIAQDVSVKSETADQSLPTLKAEKAAPIPVRFWQNANAVPQMQHQVRPKIETGTKVAGQTTEIHSPPIQTPQQANLPETATNPIRSTIPPAVAARKLSKEIAHTTELPIAPAIKPSGVLVAQQSVTTQSAIPMPSQGQNDIRNTPASALEIDPLLGPRSETSNSVSLTTTQQPQSTQPLANHVARQIAEAIQHMPNRPVEIRLNPDELGRVRLSVSSTEAGIVVSVLAERPETIDLMRRHISNLETAFQDIGYRDIAFSFSGGEQSQGDTDPNGSDQPSSELFAKGDTESAVPTQITLTPGPVTGLDLRL